MKYLIISVVSTIIALAVTAFAPSEASGYDHATGRYISVPAGSVIESDYFAMAEVVEIAGTVNGDVYAAARQIRVSGTINGDLLAVGESLAVSGTVAQDARVAGQTVTISGVVGKNVTVGGKSVEISDHAEIGGSLLAGATDLMVSAPVGRGIRAAAANMTLSGPVTGDMSVYSESLILTSGASVDGDLTYWSHQEAAIAEGARIRGKVERITPPGAGEAEKPERRFFSAPRLFLKGMSFLTLLVTGLLIIRFFPNFNATIVTKLRQRPWASLGIGFVALVMIPFVGVMLAFTVIGIPFAVLTLVSYPISIYLVRIFPAYWLGTAVFSRGERKMSEGWAYFLGLAILYTVTVIPFLGGVANVLAATVGLGAALMGKMEIFQAARKGNII